ncbi:isoleucine--tRNA ligase [Candidatus Woesearchaeota archaeon]|nr:isoleucine--tRNA ligase [Candidatus Woesearchaeota archaeon]
MHKEEKEKLTTRENEEPLKKAGVYDYKTVEQTIYDFWQKHKIYQTIKQRNASGKKFYYLDGPPYTSGKIHIGHAWGRALRDSVLRYKRAQGFDVWDRAGFDMHGLPTENAVQKNLGLPYKEDIEKFGVENFIKECKKLSVNNMNGMIQDFKKLGIWMDYDNPYMPVNNSYIEGEWWLIKKAHENGRLYEGLRTMTWCSECSSALAKHELEYEKLTDKSIYVKLRLEGDNNEYLIIWTTTPWTIPFNLAVIVNPAIKYVKAVVGAETWIVAKDLAETVIKKICDKDYKIIDEFDGSCLEGLKYLHPFAKSIDYFKEIAKENFASLQNSLHQAIRTQTNSSKLHTVVLSEEHVDTTAGTGLVHCAPGCGPEDYEVGHRNNLPPFNFVNERGYFENMGSFTSLQAKEDDKEFIRRLEAENVVVATTLIEHDYPHCWRHHTPVIFRATSQWFFKVEDLTANMKEINKTIYWMPDWAGNRQFHSWLDNLRDNSITKQRYWGTPLPVWKCKSCNDYIVIGDAKELLQILQETNSGAKLPEDLHKPYIDAVKIKCKCGKIKERVQDVLDVWVDAGCASWLCLDYPVRTDLFEKYFPADFILEGKDQIRGWFNLLFVASMVSMSKHSFNTVYMHGFINDAMGRKMSKSLGNYILPQEVIEKYGSDTCRYYMIGAANPGMDLNYNFEDMKVKYKNLGVLWNIQKFLADMQKSYDLHIKQLSELGEETDEKKLCVEDKYMISLLHTTIKSATEKFEKYQINEIPWAIENLFLQLSRTYIQLVRDRIAFGTHEEREQIFSIIYAVLYETLKMFATIAPFISEKIYLELKEAFSGLGKGNATPVNSDLTEESISLVSWPKYDEKRINNVLEKHFILSQDVIQSILGGREKIQLGIRWPLKEAVIVTENEELKAAVESLASTIQTQANVKKVHIVKEFKSISIKAKPNFKTLGPDFGKDAPAIIGKLVQENEHAIIKHLEQGTLKVKLDHRDCILRKEHFTIERKVPDHLAVCDFRYGDLYIDKERNSALDAEGYAREIMRRIQMLRKDIGLQKKDRVSVVVSMENDLLEMIRPLSGDIQEKCGADDLEVSLEFNSKKHNIEEKIKGKIVRIGLDIV